MAKIKICQEIWASNGIRVPVTGLSINQSDSAIFKQTKILNTFRRRNICCFFYFKENNEGHDKARNIVQNVILVRYGICFLGKLASKVKSTFYSLLLRVGKHSKETVIFTKRKQNPRCTSLKYLILKEPQLFLKILCIKPSKLGWDWQNFKTNVFSLSDSFSINVLQIY